MSLFERSGGQRCPRIVAKDFKSIGGVKVIMIMIMLMFMEDDSGVYLCYKFSFDS